MKKVIMLTFLSFSLFSDDIYLLKYNANTHKCSIKKNGKTIPLVDKRFKTQPQNPYTCFSIQKEQYKDCKINKKKNISAMFFGYGSYDKTNLIISLQNVSKNITSYMEIQCNKSNFYK